jgi:hypothetical protein
VNRSGSYIGYLGRSLLVLGLLNLAMLVSDEEGSRIIHLLAFQARAKEIMKMYDDG